MLIDDLKKTVTDNKNIGNALLLRNLLKEALQFYTLNYIYNSKYGVDFLFKGGTCLRFCFDLPRLSEDLDFDIKNIQSFKPEVFMQDVANYFIGTRQFKEFKIKMAGNKREIFLQFPVMRELGLSGIGESNILFLRIDLSGVDSKYYTQEVSIKSVFDLSFVITRYSLADLFASKITAIIKRTFQKGKGDIVTFKGRDYYDLIWFLERGITPNWERALDILKLKEIKEVIKLLDNKVESIKTEYLREDLLPLFKEVTFVDNFSKNFKELYRENIKKLQR